MSSSATPIGALVRPVIAECLRKWMQGRELDPAEKMIVLSAMAANDTAMRSQGLEARP